MIWDWQPPLSGRPTTLPSATASHARSLFRLSICTWMETGPPATFRIFQECLTNIVRHAQAKSVRIALYQQEESILLIVEDDGIGFHESGFSNALGSLGLLGMKERAQFCGGDVQISTSPGNGTTITIRVPVDLPRAARAEPCAS